MPRTYYVYILSSPSRVLYVGVTNDIGRRLAQHRAGDPPGYASDHGATRLVHIEATSDVRAAIGREKQIKAWTRRKRIELIEESNPHWRELAPSPSGLGVTTPTPKSAKMTDFRGPSVA